FSRCFCLHQLLILFSFQSSADLRHLHSFPTRRSSDLARPFQRGALSPLTYGRKRSPSAPMLISSAPESNSSWVPSNSKRSFNHCSAIPPLFVGPPIIDVSSVKAYVKVSIFLLTGAPFTN